ncbi:hypothetical protein V1L54_17240 [Streptomyces sp. TRM 70361]|uniref:hypothetical protein n=1 Tax=Streptomyces sp. TRM 70361 TaxID=3116553 RepID=UPI002E7C35C1|nr:hypothetical protein [Streptomyces sp. TRM 70361]MEE1941126.1 hypothetical protein [Streptomyces sp. TRM 70361]
MHTEVLDVLPRPAAEWLTRNTDNRSFGKSAAQQTMPRISPHPAPASVGREAEDQE